MPNDVSCDHSEIPPGPLGRILPTTIWLHIETISLTAKYGHADSPDNKVLEAG